MGDTKRKTKTAVKSAKDGRKKKAASSDLKTLGWREWAALPDWEVPHIKAKVDTGARTSALHAADIRVYGKDGDSRVSFTVHPWQKNDRDGVPVDLPVLDFRDVRSSSGSVERRPVVAARITLAGLTTDIEITLTDRSQMGFRMLIGREALRGRYLVVPGSSYRGGKPPGKIRTRNRHRN